MTNDRGHTNRPIHDTYANVFEFIYGDLCNLRVCRHHSLPKSLNYYSRYITEKHVINNHIIICKHFVNYVFYN